MYASKLETAERLVQSALNALTHGDPRSMREIEDAPFALYAADVRGTLTYFNKACIRLAGRRPVTGRDRWCVTWKLYCEDGALLPHDKCPMAIAIQERRLVRGLAAIAERPDGTRTAFVACPTPILDAAHTFVGAVNALVELSFVDLAEFHLGQAQKCRRLARAVTDPFAIEAMQRLADELDAKARSCLALGNVPPHPVAHGTA